MLEPNLTIVLFFVKIKDATNSITCTFNFKFNDAWIFYRRFKLLVAEKWDCEVKFGTAINNIKHLITTRNRKVFGSNSHRKRSLQNHIMGIQRSSSYSSKSSMSNLEKRLQEKLSKTLLQEKASWR